MPKPMPPPTSVPSAHVTPASTCLRSGKHPLPSAALLLGQCATAVPASASLLISEDVAWTLWAITDRVPLKPYRS
jgi:hypothetical protein